MLFTNNFYGFAASRAYYAMFYIAKVFLLDKNLTFSSHAAVIAEFGREFAKTGQVPAHFHRYLIDSQAVRFIGDYDTKKEVTKDDAEEEIKRAAEFIQFAENFFSKRTNDEENPNDET